MQMVAMQPVAQFAIALYPFLQLLKRRTPCVRFGAFLLHMLHLRQHIAALLLQLWQLALLERQLFLTLRNAFAQLSQCLLLELILSMIRYRQRFALLRQTITPPGDDLQGPLGVATMG